MPGSHSENVEQTHEYGKQTTPLSTKPQQHPVWRGLEQEDDNTSQLEHGQYSELMSVHNLCKNASVQPMLSSRLKEM